MPKVTVVIPNYNHAQFLDQRIESVFAQTYQDFELLLLDDASTDDSRAILNRYAEDPRVRTIYNETNSGSPFKQWNKGVQEASGEYIWLAEADDYAAPNLLETLVAELSHNPSVGVAYCHSLYVDKNDQILGDAEYTVLDSGKERWTTSFVCEGRLECSNYLPLQCTIPNASAALFRKEIYVQAGYADETMQMCGDWQMWIKMLLISDLSFIADPLNYFRRHSGSVSSRADRSGVFAEETYRIYEYVSNAVELSPKMIDVCGRVFLKRWLSSSVSRKDKISWKRSMAIYSVAMRADRGLKRRLPKALAIVCLKRLNLFNTTLLIAKALRTSWPNFPASISQ